MAGVGHLFGTANDGTAFADIAIGLDFANDAAIDTHVAIALDTANDAAILADFAIAFDAALDAAIDTDIAIALEAALDGAVDTYVAIRLYAANYAAALANGGIACLGLDADGEEEQKDCQFAKDVDLLFHSFDGLK